MRSFSFATLVVTCALVAPAAAQTGSQNNLVLTILGGAVTGHDLWAVDKQLLCVIPSGGGPCSSNYDTLRLSRSVGSSLALGVAATYYPWPHVGFHAELSYLGLPTDANCTGLFYNADAENKNEQVCDDISAQSGAGGAIVVFVGVMVRATPRRTISPYLRGSVGIVNQARSMTEVIGAFSDATGFHERQVIADPSPGRNSAMLGAALGFTTPLGTGYQFRFEVRDAIVSLERVTGAANALGTAPTASRTYHHFALTLGFDVVLERKRGRRY
jgi:hypothetical protein